VIIGAMLADPGGQLYAGESYVVFGRDTARLGNFPALFPLAIEKGSWAGPSATTRATSWP